MKIIFKKNLVRAESEYVSKNHVDPTPKDVIGLKEFRHPLFKQIMGLLERFQSVEGEYFQYRKSVKCISEALLVISSLTAFCSAGILIGLGVRMQALHHRVSFADEDIPNKDVIFALFIYSVLILIVSISDIVFTLILRFGIQKLKTSYCLFWRGATVTSLVVMGMLTLAFITMVHDLIIILGYIPSLVSKPFALWIVNGFINELAELRSFPDGNFLPGKPSFSLDDVESMKRSTTVFYQNKRYGRRFSQNPYSLSGSGTLRSIQE